MKDGKYGLIGETKTWQGNIQEIGGQFRKNVVDESGVKRGPGWIFTQEKAEDAANLEAAVNNGEVDPIGAKPKKPRTSSAASPRTSPKAVTLGSDSVQLEGVIMKDGKYGLIGETKTWQGNIQEIGGQFRKNVIDESGAKRGPGWIFSQAKAEEAANLEAAVNSGEVEPISAKPKKPRTNAAVSSPTAAIFGSKVATKATTKQQSVQKGLLSKFEPATINRSNPVRLNYPNVFTAADGIVYQIVIDTVPLPHVGQKVDFVGFMLTVARVNSENNFIDFEPLVSDGEEINYEAHIVNGKWQIVGYGEEHELIFQSD